MNSNYLGTGTLYLSNLNLATSFSGMYTPLLSWHPAARQVVNLPTAKFLGLKEVIAEVLGEGFFYADGKKKSTGVTYTYKEIVAVLTQIKLNIAEHAEHHSIEPSDANIAKLLALGYVMSLSEATSLNFIHENISYRNSVETLPAWTETLKYVADGFEVAQIISLFSVSVANMAYMKPPQDKTRLFVPHAVADSLGIKGAPSEWAESILSSYFEEDIKVR